MVSSKVQDASGRWLALDARALKFDQRTLSAVYHAALRSELTSRLEVKRARFVGTMEREPTPRERWRMEREATVDTRLRKAKPVRSPEELHIRWREQLMALDRWPRELTAQAISEPSQEALDVLEEALHRSWADRPAIQVRAEHEAQRRALEQARGGGNLGR